RRHLLRRPRRARLRLQLRAYALSDGALPAGVHADPRAPSRHAVRRARTRFPGVSARTLRRVQSGVRPRNTLRPAIGRPHRVDPDVAAARRGVALRLAAACGFAGGGTVQGVPRTARLALRQLRGAAEVALRLTGVAEALGQPRELEMHRPRVLERQARLEEAACLAPELGLRAQAPERGEQLGVAAVLGEPALGALDAKARLLLALGERQARRHLRVKTDEARAPFVSERV